MADAPRWAARGGGRCLLNVVLVRAEWLQAYPHRTDGKLYRLQTPQTPIARTCNYSKYYNDEFPSGTNMIVAVLAYTGYGACLLPIFPSTSLSLSRGLLVCVSRVFTMESCLVSRTFTMESC